MYHVGMKSFGLFCLDAQDPDDFILILRIGMIGDLQSRGQLANQGKPGKLPLMRCVCFLHLTHFLL